MLRICFSGAILAGLLPSVCAAACTPKLPYCQSRPNLSDPNVAIFIGKVRKIVRPDVPAPAASPRRQVEPFPSARNQLGNYRQEDTKYLPTATFDVIETFTASHPSEFTLQITSDVFIDGVPQRIPAFIEGQLWLIEAYYDPRAQRWLTSNCQRTKPMAAAADDNQALRAWIAGTHPPGRVHGQVAIPGGGKSKSNVPVELHSPAGKLSTTTDGQGRFSFDGLPPGMYEATTEGARNMNIDLTQGWCSYVVLLLNNEPAALR